MLSSDTNKRERFRNLIQKLALPLCEEKDRNEIINEFELLYSPNTQGQSFRHLYSDITLIINKIKADETSEEDVSNIGENLRILCETYEPHQPRDISSNLQKLYDHVNLEINRLSFIESEFAKKSEAEDREESRRNFNEVSQKYRELNKRIAKIHLELKTQQRDYVAILGIFATIVVAFASGIGASFSFMKEAAGNADIFLTGIAAIGILMISSIYGLFVCLRSVINKDGSNDLCVWPIYLFITLFVLLFIGRKFLTI